MALGCAVFNLAAFCGANAVHAGTAPALTVFNCDGRYVDVDMVSGTTLASGLYGDFAGPQSRVDGCLIRDVHVSQGVLYALMLKDPRLGDDGAQRYRVVALNAKTLKILRSYELPEAQTAQPMLFFDPAKQDLLLSRDENVWQHLAIGSGGELLSSAAALALKAPFPTYPAPYIDGQGNVIDGNRMLDAQGRLIREVRPDAVLDAALQRKFASLTLIKGSSQHYDTTILAASAGGRMVFTLGWDREDTRVPAAGIIVYDWRAGGVISSFFSTFPVAGGNGSELGVPTLYLTPDGKRIIIEQYDWRPRFESARSGEESRQSRFRTGRIAIYDADTGALRNTLTLKVTHSDRADGRVVNFSDDSRYLFYWFDGEMFVIDLVGGRVQSTITLPKGFDPETVISGPE
jgi:hypothetical protein